MHTVFVRLEKVLVGTGVAALVAPMHLSEVNVMVLLEKAGSLAGVVALRARKPSVLRHMFSAFKVPTLDMPVQVRQGLADKVALGACKSDLSRIFKVSAGGAGVGLGNILINSIDTRPNSLFFKAARIHFIFSLFSRLGILWNDNSQLHIDVGVQKILFL